MSVQVNDIGIDFSGAAINAADAALNGARFMLRYSAGAGNGLGLTQFKLCKPGEVEAAEAAGIDFIANSEWYEDRITEGASAGSADGAADLGFWQSRGLAEGASIYCSWDAAPNAALYDAVAAYLAAYDQALGGYYRVDLYAGDDAVREMQRRGVIRYGWRPNAGSWSGDPHGNFYQPAGHGLAVADTIRSLSPAHIWQNGNYWYGNGADENLILRTPVGSHLEAKFGVGHPSRVVTMQTVTAVTPADVHPDVVVRPGDTLTAIAARYPEPNITASSIAAANVDRFPSLATNISLIQVGWQLRIR